MEISYKKINNSQLFENFQNPELLNMESCQNYIPLYNNFFKLSNNNYNNINLNNNNNLKSVTNKINENKYQGLITTQENDIDKKIFFKFSPLLDPYKYLAGKYDISDNKIFALPKLENNDCYEKIMDTNNSAYVDSFFTYLTSQLLNHKDFIHGLDFYGSYLGIKNKYHIDIGDDIDMLNDSDYFHKNKHLYQFINKDHEELFNDQSRTNKKPIIVGNNIEDANILNLEDIENIENLDNQLFLNENKDETKDDETKENETKENETKDDETFNLLYENKSINIRKSKTESNSDISSRSSKTNNDEKCSNEDNSIYSDNTDSSFDSESDVIMLSVEKFPIQIISLECCENTFDYLLSNDKLNDDELTCIIIQILMMLITYQKLFNFTHNDLHTNNIMYINTDKKYLYYKYNDKHYKIPTFGKIFKIIDFGRAIYNYKNEIICSDSFHKDGDAATQYNFKPYYNDKKPILEPNMSFDLCRLGCSIYDFIIDEYETHNSKFRPIHKIITDWCVDDDNRNILYKNNDEERYPDFKLYKMIVRKVHNHTPDKELNNKLFNKYIVPKKEIKKGSKIINIDNINLD